MLAGLGVGHRAAGHHLPHNVRLGHGQAAAPLLLVVQQNRPETWRHVRTRYNVRYYLVSEVP